MELASKRKREKAKQDEKRNGIKRFLIPIFIYIYKIMKRNILLRIMNLTSTLTLFDSRRHGLSVIRSMNMERTREGGNEDIKKMKISRIIEQDRMNMHDGYRSSA